MKKLFISILFSIFTISYTSPVFASPLPPHIRPFGGFVAVSPLPPPCPSSPINSPFVIDAAVGLFGPFAADPKNTAKQLRPGTPVLGLYSIKPMPDCVVASPIPIPVKPFVVGPSPVFPITLFGVGR